MRGFIGTTALGSAGVGSGLRSLAGVGRGLQAFMGLGSRSSSNAPHSFNYSAFLYDPGKQFLLKSLRVPSKQSLLFLSHDCRFSELAAIHEEAGVFCFFSSYLPLHLSAKDTCQRKKKDHD